MSMTHLNRRGILLTGLSAAVAGRVSAQGTPSAVTRLVVPFPAGGTSDNVARLLAQHLSVRMKAPVVVENRAGAGTAIGAAAVAKSTPDGRTLLLTSPGIAINAAMRPATLGYDTEADLEPVATLALLPMAIYASTASGFRTLQDVLAAARAKPDGISYGTAGEGSTGHLSMKLLEQMAGVKLTHVPFQGSAPSMTALLGGHIALAADTAFLGSQHVAAGKVIGIATLGKTRSRLLPQVPTATEGGTPLESAAWFGISVRIGAPRAAVSMLNEHIRAVLREPQVHESLEKDGFEIIADTEADAKASFRTELTKMAAAVRAAK